MRAVSMLLSAADPPVVAIASAPIPAPAIPKLAGEADTEVSGIVVSPPKVVVPPGWSAKLNLDPQGIYKESETPYLRTRPVDSCKPMAGGAKPGFAGKSGFASGIVCVKRF